MQKKELLEQIGKLSLKNNIGKFTNRKIKYKNCIS